MKKTLIFGGIAVALIAVLLWFAKKNSKSPIQYETEKPFKTNIVKKTVATGKVVPLEEAEIKPKVSGIIEEIFVEEGAEVAVGDLIATIRVVPNVQSLNSAQGSVKTSQLRYDNTKILFERNKITNIRSFDIDASCSLPAETLNRSYTQNDWQFKASTMDVNNLTYNDEFMYETLKYNGDKEMITDGAPTCVINTSCEHIVDFDKWWSGIPDGMLVIMQNNDFDVVLSDMAPRTTGNPLGDHVEQLMLATRAAELAKSVLRPGGHFVVKVFDGEDAHAYVQEVRADYDKHKRVRPEAVRRESREFFLVCTGFRSA